MCSNCSLNPRGFHEVCVFCDNFIKMNLHNSSHPAMTQKFVLQLLENFAQNVENAMCVQTDSHCRSLSSQPQRLFPNLVSQRDKRFPSPQ